MEKHKENAQEEIGYEEALKLLTPREIKVLEMVGQGYTCRKVAKHFNLSVYTVRTHVKNIKEKLDVDGYRGLVSWYREHWEE